MKNRMQTFWVIRAGQKSGAYHLFTEKSLIVLEDQAMGDLRMLPNNREAFYTRYMSRNGGEWGAATRGIGGKFFRFIHEVKPGHIILYPCILDKKVYFGAASGKYFYDESNNKEYPHRRKVIWHGSFPKAALSEFGKRELGAARTFFRYAKNAEELQKLIANQRNRKSKPVNANT